MPREPHIAFALPCHWNAVARFSAATVSI